MEAGVHSIWISEQLQELGHEVIVAHVRELSGGTQEEAKKIDYNRTRPEEARLRERQSTIP